MADREVHIGDLYYNDTTRSLFIVRGKNASSDPNCGWVMSSVDGVDRTLFMYHKKEPGDWLHAMRTGSDFKVIVGSIWYSLGFKDLFKVVRDNSNRETGPDSWEMRGENTGKTLYMHHSDRVQDVWMYISGPEISEPIPVVHRSRYHRTPVI